MGLGSFGRAGVWGGIRFDAETLRRGVFEFVICGLHSVSYSGTLTRCEPEVWRTFMEHVKRPKMGLGSFWTGVGSGVADCEK